MKRRFSMDFTGRKRMSKLTMGFLILLYLIFTSRECESHEINRCTSKETCGKCIEEGPECAWCGQEDYTEKKIPRCDFVKNLREETCSDIINPDNNVTITKDRELSKKGAELNELVQIKPQRIKIELRPNSPQTIRVWFRQAEDYPVDLYYLMDLSYTMLDDKEKLVTMSRKLATEMQKLTRNFHLGFGSFVDKVVAPFANMHPSRAENPCYRSKCAKNYGFRHHMSLSSNVSDFTNKVRDSEISANVDRPEGTLDAVMQAVVCTKKIGWRAKSRKLLIVVTDADFHFAGDGKIGGIIKPNDGKCHLDENGFYYESTNRDYPSISQLNRKIKENNINVIFAVTKEHEGLYQNLSRRLVGSKTGELASDSSNVVDLIKEQYDAITSSVEMTDTAKSSNNIEISYYSSCLTGTYKKRNVCNGIRPGKAVSFNAKVKFSMCPLKREDWKKQIKIQPVGLSEKLILDLELMCECECKKTQQEEENNRHKFCSGKGTYECGVCKCDSNAYGMQCECGANGTQTTVDDSSCKRGNEERPCSNRGECQCGKCQCDERVNPGEIYYGQYCECSNFNCDQINKKMCSGQGVCDCGTCRCHKGWKGPNCDCSDSTKNCVAENGGDICSGHGICDCGSCKCDETYYGKFCDDCLGTTSLKDVMDNCPDTPFIASLGDPYEQDPVCTVVLEKEHLEKMIPLSDALAMWFSCYYVFNMQYPASCAATLEFIQRVFLNINPERGTKMAKRQGKRSGYIHPKTCTAKCEEYKACIECKLQRKGQDMQNDCEDCSTKNATVTFVDKVTVDGTQMEKACAIRDEEGCAILYKYRMEDNNHPVIHAQAEKECPTPVDVVAIASGTVGSIVLAGLVLLLMWKILTVIHDRRELAKFEKDIQKAKWDSGDNPIFVEPTSTFQNPVFSPE